MSEAAIRARIDAQAPLEDKAAVADFLVDNGGTIAELENRVERLWHDLSARAVA
jgi:dephospho-CoA kinase